MAKVNMTIPAQLHKYTVGEMITFWEYIIYYQSTIPVFPSSHNSFCEIKYTTICNVGVSEKKDKHPASFFVIYSSTFSHKIQPFTIDDGEVYLEEH